MQDVFSWKEAWARRRPGHFSLRACTSRIALRRDFFVIMAKYLCFIVIEINYSE